jgi:hypothetical protein
MEFGEASASPSTPAPEMTAAQRAQATYEDARIACHFQYRQEEAKQRAEVGNDVAADENLQLCLDRADAERRDAPMDLQLPSQPLPRVQAPR